MRVLLACALPFFVATAWSAPEGGALAGERYRVVVSTDVGGTDPDDLQSLVHLLLYADLFDVEGLISSPYGPGRRENILDVAPSGMTRQHANDGRVLRFRFSPRDAKVWRYTVLSDFAAVDGMSGRFTAVVPPAARTSRASARHPSWWTDDPAPESAEGIHPGAGSVSQWREDFLRHFAGRLSRCRGAD